MDEVGAWLLPLLAVIVLGAGTLLFALFIGRWIDSQSSSVVESPRERMRDPAEKKRPE
jgi:hypothetical protein